MPPEQAAARTPPPSGKPRLDSPQRHTTADGRTIYLISIETFPSFFNNVYLLDDGARLVLFDCGSGLGNSDQSLLAGLRQVEQRFGRRIALADVSTVIITHAHTDHFGGLEFVRSQTDAPIGVHTLDRRVLSHYEERVIVAARHLELFLQGAGVSAQSRAGLMAMYKAPKGRFKSLPVDFCIEEGEPVPDGHGGTLDLEAFHTPGHCPGQVCLRAGDVLFTADHVLARITPHQAPESITLNMGLLHYLGALAKIERVGDIRLGLGGHEEPIADVAARISAIRAAHDERLNKLLDACAGEPRTTAELSRGLFGTLHGYNVLLGLEETGAHVEYLHLRGEIVAANIEELDSGEAPVVRYLRA